MRITHGAVIYSISNEVKKQLDESDSELLATLIPVLHEQSQSTATEVILPFAVPDLPEEYLRQTVEPKGDRRKLLELSIRNVESYRKQCLHQRALTQGEAAPQAVKLLERLQKALQLPTLPLNIDCFDNSHLQGAYPVAGMVRFTAGKPNRNAYRKFNIRAHQGNDDYASMVEVIERQYSKNPTPDLLVVDGGEGQMRAAWQVTHNKMGLDIPIAGLAKDDRHRTNELLCFKSTRLHDKDSLTPAIQVVQLKPTDPLFHLLERLQDEVHRFAVTYHKDKRSKGTFRTTLTDIPGVGEKTAHELLLRFGSVKQIQIQTLDDLAAVIGPAKAKTVYSRFHPND